MGKLTVLALRIVLAIAFAGSLFVQAVMVPLFWADLEEAPAEVRVPVVVIVTLGIVTMQVTAVCVWRLLTGFGEARCSPMPPSGTSTS